MHMRKTIYTVMLISLSLLMTSCHAWYNTQMADVPLLQGKGDVRVTGGVNTAAMFPYSLSGTASVGVTDHIGAQLYGSYSDADQFHFHGAGGYYTYLGESHWVLETYGGAGMGSTFNSAARDEETKAPEERTAGDAVRFTYQQYFCQLNIGMADVTAVHFDFGVGLRAGVMPYSLRVNERDKEPKIDEHGVLPLFEPVAFVRIGTSVVKFQVQVGTTTMALQEDRLHDAVAAMPFSLYGGLSFNF